MLKNSSSVLTFLNGICQISRGTRTFSEYNTCQSFRGSQELFKEPLFVVFWPTVLEIWSIYCPKMSKTDCGAWLSSGEICKNRVFNPVPVAPGTMRPWIIWPRRPRNSIGCGELLLETEISWPQVYMDLIKDFQPKCPKTAFLAWPSLFWLCRGEKTLFSDPSKKVRRVWPGQKLCGPQRSKATKNLPAKQISPLFTGGGCWIFFPRC